MHITPTIPYYLIVNQGSYETDAVNAYRHHLVLADVLNQHAHCMKRAKQWVADGKHVILDNGAHEGEVFDQDKYLAMILELEPTVAVLPDEIGKPSSTSWTTSMRFAERILHAAPTIKTQFMLAVQGTSELDILSGYLRAFEELGSDRFRIGFGQSYLTFVHHPNEKHSEAARFRLIAQVWQRLVDATQRMRVPRERPTAHVLGGRWTPTNAYGALNMLGRNSSLTFTGLDSIKPLRCALAGTTYPNWTSTKDVRLSLHDSRCVNDDHLILNIASFCRAYSLVSDIT